ncbi:MAG: VCBS repeat-containing protein, partial [Cytophagales bacterium]|nr:VCBS repeat-containing protein [Cytophagales bacterium]
MRILSLFLLGTWTGMAKADLAVTNGSGSSVSVFRNTGSVGTISYAAKVDFTTGSFPYPVSIGDLDGDGKADLALANEGSNTVSVFRNTGSAGTISYAAKVDFTTGSLPFSVSIGDLDGDGKADLAVANYSSNTVSVFRNTGSPGTISYAAKVDFTTGSGSGPNSVSIGDLDGDGKADLAVANYNSNTVSVIRNTGSAGTISYAAKVDFTTGFAPYSVSIGDLDGDGKADLAVANGSGSSVSVFRNTGSAGTISYAAKVDFTTGLFPYSVSIGDLDGDGKADLAIANQSSNTVSVFRNTGSAGTISYAAKVDFATGSDPSSASIGDLDEDGKADLAVANASSNTVSVFRNTGSAGTISYATKVDFATGISPLSVSIGDLDGDGKADLAVANKGSNTVSVFRNTGSAGTISYAAKVDFAADEGSYSVSIGDLDGDGKADLAVANYNSNTVS